MSKVENIQLGREMEYPYEGSRPNRQIAKKRPFAPESRN